MSAIVLSSDEANQRKINDAINQYAQGRSNAVGTFTLTASATTTTVPAPTCGVGSFVLLSPQTAHAANDMATTSVVAGKGQFVVTHANNSRVDRTFGFAVFG
jgi:hypothetical protein